MIEIFTQTDLNYLEKRKLLPVSFHAYLQARFDELKRCLSEYSDVEDCEFSLKSFGHLVVLQQADNLYDLEKVGLNSEDKGLFGAIPEVVEEIMMEDMSVYQISIVYNNSYMMIFYMQKGVFETKYPELQEYLKDYPPEPIVFKPQGSHKPVAKKKWLFDGKRYKTQGVDIHIPDYIQSDIWNYIEERKQGEIPLDYLQVFNLYPATKDGKIVQVVDFYQEQPEYKQLLYIQSSFTVKEKIYVIDDVDHLTMLLAREY